MTRLEGLARRLARSHDAFASGDVLVATSFLVHRLIVLLVGLVAGLLASLGGDPGGAEAAALARDHFEDELDVAALARLEASLVACFRFCGLVISRCDEESAAQALVIEATRERLSSLVEARGRVDSPGLADEIDAWVVTLAKDSVRRTHVRDALAAARRRALEIAGERWRILNAAREIVSGRRARSPYLSSLLDVPAKGNLVTGEARC